MYFFLYLHMSVAPLVHRFVQRKAQRRFMAQRAGNKPRVAQRSFQPRNMCTLELF